MARSLRLNLLFGREVFLRDFEAPASSLHVKEFKRCMKSGFELRYFLIVEDDAADAMLIQRTFDSISPRCKGMVCRNTSEARAYLKGAGMYANRERYPFPDAIISDVQMPQESGLELIKWIRSEEKFNDLPLIILTGAASAAEMETATQLGAQMVLEKPARPSSLKALLQGVAETLCNPPAPELSNETV